MGSDISGNDDFREKASVAVQDSFESIDSRGPRFDLGGDWVVYKLSVCQIQEVKNKTWLS